MAASKPDPDDSLVSFFAELGLVLLLAAACVLIPLAVAVLVSPSLGLALAVGSFWVWGRLGPRPFPGLLPGLLSLLGCAAILGSSIGCLVLAVRGGSLAELGCFFLVAGVLWLARKWYSLFKTRGGSVGLVAIAAPSCIWLGLALLWWGGWLGWPWWAFIAGWLLSVLLAGWVLDRTGRGRDDDDQR
jgi:hypothetical protein